MNNKEREMWVMNDEGLYMDWKRSRLSITGYLKINRAEIDRYIFKIIGGGY